MKRIFWLCAGIVVILFVGAAILLQRVPVKTPRAYGITFSAMWAEKFGLDARQTYRAILDDLGVRKLRLPAYWDRVEPAQGAFDFTELDWQISEAKKRGASVILAMGYKLPRWPECHSPEWAQRLTPVEQTGALFTYIEQVVRRYKSSSAITVWQVENEPFLTFGVCPPFSVDTLDAEIAKVRALDSRPIMITDSGELSTWLPAHTRADIFGSTMYRSIWNASIGTTTYPLPPSFFRLKRALVELVDGAKPAVVVELQGEPWEHKQNYEIEPEEQYKTMNPQLFRNVLAYSARTGFDEFYLWGAEWWYWLKEKRDMPEMWNLAKETIQSVQSRRLNNQIR